MAEPRTHEEQMELNPNKDQLGFWIGINDRLTEGVYVYESNGSPVDYTHWRIGTQEPNDHLIKEPEDCVVVGNHGGLIGWVDVACFSHFHFICQIDIYHQ